MARGYDPVREETHWTLICDGITLGLLTAAQWYAAAQQLSDPATAVHYPLMGWVILIMALGLPTYLIINRIASFRRFRKRWASTLHLREMARTGIAPLYSPPSQEPLSITLPYTLRLHLNKGFFKSHRFKLLKGVVPIVVLVLLGLALKIGISTWWGFLAILLVPMLVDPAGFISLLVQESWHSPTLILDDESITAHYWGDRVTMRWDAAQYFTLIGQERAFELSDGTNTIRWLDISAGANHPYVPAMDLTQYTALMQTLPHWICTRTGLPLYDLRSQQEGSASNASIDISQTYTSIPTERDSSSADQNELPHEQPQKE